MTTVMKVSMAPIVLKMTMTGRVLEAEDSLVASELICSEKMRKASGSELELVRDRRYVCMEGKTGMATMQDE